MWYPRIVVVNKDHRGMPGKSNALNFGIWMSSVSNLLQLIRFKEANARYSSCIQTNFEIKEKIEKLD